MARYTGKTYKESYEELNTLEEIEKEVNSDIATAYIINPDRVAVIIKSADEVLKEKFGTSYKGMSEELKEQLDRTKKW